MKSQINNINRELVQFLAEASSILRPDLIVDL